MNSQQQGRLAESLALSWLETHDYQCIERNFSRRIGEIDLIVRSKADPVIVFVEVRFRSHLNFGGGAGSIDTKKQNRLRRTAKLWLQRNAHSKTIARIDVICISPAKMDTPRERLWQGHDVVWITNAIED